MPQVADLRNQSRRNRYDTILSQLSHAGDRSTKERKDRARAINSIQQMMDADPKKFKGAKAKLNWAGRLSKNDKLREEMKINKEDLSVDHINKTKEEVLNTRNAADYNSLKEAPNNDKGTGSAVNRVTNKIPGTQNALEIANFDKLLKEDDKKKIDDMGKEIANAQKEKEAFGNIDDVSVPDYMKIGSGAMSALAQAKENKEREKLTNIKDKVIERYKAANDIANVDNTKDPRHVAINSSMAVNSSTSKSAGGTLSANQNYGSKNFTNKEGKATNQTVQTGFMDTDKRNLDDLRRNAALADAMNIAGGYEPSAANNSYRRALEAKEARLDQWDANRRQNDKTSSTLETGQYGRGTNYGSNSVSDSFNSSISKSLNERLADAIRDSGGGPRNLPKHKKYQIQGDAGNTFEVDKNGNVLGGVFIRPATNSDTPLTKKDFFNNGIMGKHNTDIRPVAGLKRELKLINAGNGDMYEGIVYSLPNSSARAEIIFEDNVAKGRIIGSDKWDKADMLVNALKSEYNGLFDYVKSDDDETQRTSTQGDQYMNTRISK